MSVSLFVFSALAMVLFNFGIFAFIAYKFPVFFKTLYLISRTKRRESLFYGSILFAVTIAGIFLFSKSGSPINLPIMVLSFAGLFGCITFIASLLKINPLTKPYKAIAVGILIIFVLSSISYIGDAVVFLFKAYGIGVILVYIKFRREIKLLDFKSGINDEKIRKLASFKPVHISISHIAVQIAALLVIAVYSVVFRNFTVDLTDKIVSQMKSAETAKTAK
jgi:hypothetical protein